MRKTGYNNIAPIAAIKDTAWATVQAQEKQERKKPQKTYNVTDELDSEKYAYLFVPEMGDFLLLNIRRMQDGPGGYRWRGSVEYSIYEVKHGKFRERKSGSLRFHNAVPAEDGRAPSVDGMIPTVLGRLYDDPDIAYTRFLKTKAG